MTRRLIIAVAALVFAVAGIAGVLSYVRGADARALAGTRAVGVLVAQKSIPAGTEAGAALQQGLLASQKLPASAVPADAVRAISAAQSSLVLNASLEPGQLLLGGTLVAATQVTSGLAIPPGMMAVTANFCVPEAVAGTLRANSEVAVFDTVVSDGSAQVTAQAACDGPHQQAGPGTTTRVVLSRVQVLSVGESSAAGSAGSSSGTAASGQAEILVTMAVSQVNAEKLIQIAETGLPYLALLTTSSRVMPDIGALLQIQPSPTPTPTQPAATPSQGPSSLVTAQPSSSPNPLLIIPPTSTPSTSQPTASPCAKGVDADANIVRAQQEC